ncbi:hypothetical protein M9H77_18720 [Catharanthus roseus]|uniref:Uncharacterized protein n=1 Tax=Catharanthus roseus TaxID=4058 RepID=A0ACC0B871_CATRO|nr:hypothetical protein M9H77_18720 [Catharanthus roseus]
MPIFFKIRDPTLDILNPRLQEGLNKIFSSKFKQPKFLKTNHNAFNSTIISHPPALISDPLTTAEAVLNSDDSDEHSSIADGLYCFPMLYSRADGFLRSRAF